MTDYLETDYIGVGAKLIPVQWSITTSEAVADRYAFQDAPGKRWAFVSRRKSALREWSLSVEAENASASVLMGFAHGAYGLGPWWWAPVESHASNLIPPSASLLSGASGAGVETVEGWSMRSVLGPAEVELASGVPVLPGAPVTASIDASGPARLVVRFRSGSGAIVAQVEEQAAGSLMQRVSRTVPVVPATARTVDVAVAGHVSAAHPQVTWTEGVVPWAVGGGAPQVVISGVSRTLKVIDQGSRDSWWSLEAKMTEVG